MLLDRAVIDPEHGWRAAFLIGALLAGIVFFMRLWLPESPRWLMTHGRAAEAEAVVAGIEDRLRAEGHAIAPGPLPKVRLRSRTHTPLADVAHTLIHLHRQRTLVALALMAAQAFFYNAIFFTYALVLTTFYGIPSQQVGWYILPFAAGNVLGPLLLGRLFDTLGRRPMIAFTYLMSGAAARAHRLAVRAGHAERARADPGVERDLLLRVRRGKLGLSDGERDVSAGDPRACDRAVLRGRHRHRRRDRAAPVRRTDRHRLAHRACSVATCSAPP